jgi:retron-type reverse transcriptase
MALHRNIKNTRDLCNQKDKDNIRQRTNEKNPKTLLRGGSGEESCSDFDKASFLSGSMAGASISMS